MSYILDALKRAEQERQLGQMPNAAIAPSYDDDDNEPRHWPWFLLAGFVLVGLSGGVGFWLSQGASTPASSEPTASPKAPPTALIEPAAAPRYNDTMPTRVVAITNTPQVIKLDQPEPAQPAAKVTTNNSPRQTTAASQPNSASVADSPAAANSDDATPPPEILAMEAIALGQTESQSPQTGPQPGTEQGSQQGPEPTSNNALRNNSTTKPPEPKVIHLSNQPATDAVPLLNETDPSFRRTVPSLQLQFHRYSTDPERSFVLIDGTRYRAGQTLNAGPTLEQIVENGLLLRWQGQRFIYPAGG